MTTRRTIIASATLASVLASPLGKISRAAAQERHANFVLVHGAYAGGWAWRKVIPLLASAGHAVYATTATGMGDRVHLADPAINLDTYITDVVNVLEYEDLSDVTLVGHSFGGFIISGVAERVPERLAQLVYLDAIVPKDGQTNYQFWGFNEEGIGFEYQMGVEAGWPGFEVVYAGVEEFIRAMVADPADADWYISKMTPQPLAVSAQPNQLGNPAAAALPHVFVDFPEGKGSPEEDPLARVAEQVQTDPAWTYIEVAGNHMALVNNPRETAEALLSLV
jgi:pimeloyl-ACP methyl ester carboxylesterase